MKVKVVSPCGQPVTIRWVIRMAQPEYTGKNHIAGHA